MINRLLGFQPKLITKENTFVITNVNGRLLVQTLNKVWGTTRLGKYLFKTVSRGSVEIYQFYALEFIYVLEELIGNQKNRLPVNTISTIINLLKADTWIKNTINQKDLPLNTHLLNQLTVTLLPDQKEFVQNYFNTKTRYNLRGMLLSSPPGTGKTIGSLGLSLVINNKKTIVFSPKNAIDTVWKHTIKTRMKGHKKVWVSNQSPDDITGKEDYIVIHYEFIPKFIKLLRRFKLGKVTVILDESHNLNELKTNRTKLFIKLCNDLLTTEDVILMSGTPVKAVSLETIPLLRVIDPLFIPSVEDSYKRLYTGNTNRATEVLKYRMGVVQHQVEKSLEGLPDPLYEDVYVEFKGSEKYTLPIIKQKMLIFIKDRERYYQTVLPEKKIIFQRLLDKHQEQLTTTIEKNNYRLYLEKLEEVIHCNGNFACQEAMVFCNQYENNHIRPSLNNEDKKVFKDVKSIIKYVKLKIMGEALGQVIGRARIDCHKEMAKHIDIVSICERTDRKTVVFSNYTEVVDSIVIQLRAKQWKPVTVYAKTNKDIDNIISRFEKDPLVNPLCATLASLSTAIPLVMADTMVFIDVPFRSYMENQAISRIWRLGQTSIPKIYYVRLDTNGVPNISDRNFDILKWSAEEVKNITGVDSTIKMDELTPSLEGYIETIENLSK